MTSRLNWECRRAFLDQCLRNICVQKVETSAFFKYLFISKRLLICSRSKHSKIYRLILFRFEYNYPQFCLAPYSDRDFGRIHEYFPLEYDYALKLINLLCPSLLEVQFYGWYHLIGNNWDKYKEVMGLNTVNKIAFVANIEILKGGLEQLIVKYASKISELECNYNFTVPPQLPAMKLEYCRLFRVKSIDQLHNFLSNQQVKKLSVEFDCNEIGQIGPRNIPMKRKLTDDFPINSCVIELNLESSSYKGFKSMTNFLSQVKVSFPRLQKLNIEARFYNDEIVGSYNQIPRIDPLIDVILKYHQKFKTLEMDCNELQCITSIVFGVNLEYMGINYNSNWTKELEKRAPFKLAQYTKHRIGRERCDQISIESGNDKQYLFDISIKFI